MKKTFDFSSFRDIFAPRMENTIKTTMGAGNLSAVQDHENLLADLSAFVADIVDHPTMDDSRKLSLIAGTVLHDIGGTLNRERCFLPRVNGYASRSYRQSFPASA